MFTTTEVRSVSIGGTWLRVAVRPGRPKGRRLSLTGPGTPRVPLLLVNGIGAGSEAIYSYEGTREVNTLIVGRDHRHRRVRMNA
ncbi:MAG TPA: hypothetical protein VED20_03280 [Streptosporangiaceae bacterium]|nr:hypothetical protein [Streptosporangiaceae bacterium]